MKRFLLSLIVVLISVFSMQLYSMNVYAREVSGMFEITEDIDGGGETISINSVSGNYAVNISDGVTVKNVKFEFDTSVTSTYLFNVGDGVVFENVQITCNNKLFENGIYVSGNKFIVRGLAISNVTNAIVTSDNDNPIVSLYKSDSDMTIVLNSGYVEVYPETEILGLITLDVGCELENLDDSAIGRVLVKGGKNHDNCGSEHSIENCIGVQANYFMDKFCLSCDNADIFDFDENYSDFYDYLKENKSFYMDYAGDLGEYSGISSGDIIITKFNIHATNGEPDENGANEEGEVYFAGRYATCDIMLKATGAVYVINGKIIENSNATTKLFAINNYTAMHGHNTYGTVVLNKIDGELQVITDSVGVTIKTKLGGNDAETYKRITVNNGGTSSVFVPLNGNQFVDTAIDSDNNIEIVSTSISMQYVKIVFSVSETASNPIITVNLNESIQTVQVDLLIANNITYSGEDNAAPYYLLNEEPVFISGKYFKLEYSNTIDGDYTVMGSKQAINAGFYKITILDEFSASNPNIVFNNNQINFVINKKTVEYSGQTEFIYDGTVKSLSLSVMGKCGSDVVNIVYPNDDNFLIEPGEKTIELSLDNSNYILQNSECVLKVKKSTIAIPDNWGFEITEIFANEDINIITLNNIPEEITINYSYDKVDYDNSQNLEYCRWKYIVSATINYDDELYDCELDKGYIITAEILVKKIVININTGLLYFENIVAEYTGEEFKTEVELVDGYSLPSEIDRIEYTNNVQSQANDTPYIATATFVLKKVQEGQNLVDLAERYMVVPASLNASITINKANFRNYFTLGSTTFVYDGNTHGLTINIHDETKISAEYLSQEFSSVGDHEQKYRIYILDTNNLCYDNDDSDNDIVIEYIHIAKATFDMSNVTFESDENRNYDMNNTQSLCVTGQLPVGIKVEYTYYKGNLLLTSLPKDVGTYTVNANFSHETWSEGSYVAIPSMSATLKIIPIDVDMSAVTFLPSTFDYDGQTKSVVISGTLPEFVSVEYVNNSSVDVCDKVAVAKFTVNSINYNPLADMTCSLIIRPRSVQVKLIKETFKYTGEAITVIPVIIGLVNNDDVEAILFNTTNTLARVHFAKVTGLQGIKKDNYKIVGSTDLKYVIEKANYDMTGVSFPDVQIKYNGQDYTPELIGELPAGVSKTIIKDTMINVGEYTVRCEFDIDDENYNIPPTLECNVSILPKSIFVRFNNYQNLVEDGEEKRIGVSFEGILESTIPYNYEYSCADYPKSAGKYTLTVSLPPNSNYVIVGDGKCNFEILATKKNFVSDNYDITISGGTFSEDSNIEIIEDDSEMVKNAIQGIDAKKYKAFSISSIEDDKEITISMSLKTFSTKSSNLKLYKVINGELIKIDYIMEDSVLKFTANTNDQIVLIEEKSFMDKYLILIITLSVIIGGGISCGTTIAIIKIKKKKVSNK